jgi:hypothetical protein
MSFKKISGTVGCGVIYLVASYAVCKDPSLIGQVLWPLILFVSTLFGLKIATGAVNNLKQKSPEQKPEGTTANQTTN